MAPTGYLTNDEEDPIDENVKFGPKENPTGYKRSPLDKCNNHDYFRFGDTYLIQCDPDTGVWSYVENSIASSFNFRSWNYDCKIPRNELGTGWCRIGGNLKPLVPMKSSECYAQKGEYYSPNRRYAGSSYTHIMIGKVKIDLTVIDAGFLYGSFACVVGDSETSKYSQNINVVAPVKPTEEMLIAGDGYIGTPATYKAMISAIPNTITTEFSQFLKAVMDAAGLVRHGRQSKELSEYLGSQCMKYRLAAAPSAPKADDPVKQMLLEALDNTATWIEQLPVPTVGAAGQLVKIDKAIAAARQEGGK
jgi:hypothetical protein